MDGTVAALAGIGAAFGLATSAGLNAYIPLLLVALTAKFTHFVQLSEPYDVLVSWWVIGVLAVLLIIETFVDKVPALDSINDIIHTFIRPTAGAFLFAATSGVITEISPVIAVIAGILVAGSVHGLKTAARPLVTASTGGTGNWLVSIIEDIISFFVSLLSIFIPVLLIFVLIFVVYAGITIWQRRRQKTVNQL